MNELMVVIDRAAMLSTDLRARLERISLNPQGRPDAQLDAGALSASLERIRTFQEGLTPILESAVQTVQEHGATACEAMEEGGSALEESSESTIEGLETAASDISSRIQEIIELFQERCAGQIEDVSRQMQERLEALSEQVRTRIENACGQFQGRADSTLQQATENLERGCEDTSRSALETVERARQLSSDIASAAKRIETSMTSLQGGLRVTQTGLNVTAGTFQQAIDLFSDLV